MVEFRDTAVFDMIAKEETRRNIRYSHWYPCCYYRGLKEDDVRKVAHLILEALQAEESELEAIHKRAKAIVAGRPLHQA